MKLPHLCSHWALVLPRGGGVAGWGGVFLSDTAHRNLMWPERHRDVLKSHHLVVFSDAVPHPKWCWKNVTYMHTFAMSATPAVWHVGSVGSGFFFLLIDEGDWDGGVTSGGQLGCTNTARPDAHEHSLQWVWFVTALPHAVSLSGTATVPVSYSQARQLLLSLTLKHRNCCCLLLTLRHGNCSCLLLSSTATVAVSYSQALQLLLSLTDTQARQLFLSLTLKHRNCSCLLLSSTATVAVSYSQAPQLLLSLTDTQARQLLLSLTDTQARQLLLSLTLQW